MSMRLMFVDIADNLVTNAEYWAFCEATGRDKGKTSTGRPNQPVVNVSWYDAMDYACWKAEQDGIPWRLPLEEELKEAEALIPADADFSEWPLPELPDVGSHPQTSNSLGHNDLVGVVYQWTMRPEDKAKYDTTWDEYVQKRKAAEEAWIREQSWKTDAEMSEIIAIPEVEVTSVLCEADPSYKPPTQADLDLRPAVAADWGSVQPRPEDQLDRVGACLWERGGSRRYPTEYHTGFRVHHDSDKLKFIHDKARSGSAWYYPGQDAKHPHRLHCTAASFDTSNLGVRLTAGPHTNTER